MAQVPVWRGRLSRISCASRRLPRPLRAAGSRSATCRATESTPGRAYRSRERTDAWREWASSIGVEVPSSEGRPKQASGG
ncbi:hypothetical protein SAM9427_36225 (plasmid) [Streptomyces sp. ETH9427]|nr:hypothetical protein SAM9427_36225 [Streptomyces sp. ETH9427]